jgi:hypothetical protein
VLYLLLHRILELVVLFGRGDRAKEIEIVALGTRSPYCAVRSAGPA